MKLRIITGVTAALLLLVLLYLGSLPAVMTAVLVAATLAYLEYDHLFFSAKSVFRHLRMVVLIAFTVLAVRQNPSLGWLSFWFSFIFLCLFHVLNSDKTGDFQKTTRALSLELLGYIYIVSLFGFLVPIVETSDRGRDYLLLLFLIVFVGDSVAYFVGSRFGKRRLAPLLSPKKTFEGAVAAVLSSLIVAFFWYHYVLRPGSESRLFLKILIFAPIGSVLAQFGDLFESLLKRSQMQKDSGSFLPGHGGMLDRIDGFALISPVYYVYLTFILERA